jgi:hypothetical protein
VFSPSNHFKTNIVGGATLKYKQWLKWANNQNVALAHSLKIKKAFSSIAPSFN